MSTGTRAADFSDDLLWADCDDFELPFQFGGASQKGRLQPHTNNQDSLALWSRGPRVVGVVCDGCGSSQKGHANTELGARILSIAATHIVGEAMATNGVAALDWGMIEEAICTKIVAVADTLLPKSKPGDILHNLMMSTILGFAIDQDAYAVFGCGDGMFVLNGVSTSLDSQHGRYLAARIALDADWRGRLASGDRAIVVHRAGPISDLRNLLIGTDGVEELQERFSDKFGAFVANGESDPSSAGLCSSVAWEFRAAVWRAREVEEWAKSQDRHDDRSFVVVRRTTPIPVVETAPAETGSVETAPVETAAAIAATPSDGATAETAPAATGDDIAKHK